MVSIFDKPYEPKEYEENIYRMWEKSGFFNPDNLKDTKGAFSMVLPPPNVTGVLHVGHALTITIEDILARHQRMCGKKTLWLPGTDHASIATETKFLKEKKINRNEYNGKRDEFIALINDYALQNQSVIIKQIRTMGASLDWSRIAFTLDEKRQHAVYEAFFRMNKAGLIKHGEYLINWDIKGQTTVSDDEIEYETMKGSLYTFKYAKDFPIPIATTRPETKLGDVAVAVHPEGKWKKYIGKEYKIENFAGVELNIKIIGDEAVDPEFGTGAVGITPAHSKIDGEIAQRHGLPAKQIINEYGLIINTGTEWDGKIKIKEAREKVIEWLKNEKLLEKEEVIEHNVAKAQRSGGTIEILPKCHQFFISVNTPIPERGGKTLKELMREAVAGGKIKIIPEHFEKTYFHWIDSLHDWNISRQVWYGHRIPAWYHEPKCVPRQGHEGDIVKCEEFIISAEKPRCEFCDAEFVQGTDTFDTWFSSGLWTFSTLGWPAYAETAMAGKPGPENDLANFHPIDVLETGYDILFFWIAKMILMSTFLLGDIPFRTVYLHGLVRDEQKRKMSKSLGNVINPLDMTAKYGTDALRMALIFGTAPGTDSVISEDKIKGMRNFSNKLWNIARFVLTNTAPANEADPKKQTAADKDILEKLAETEKNVTKNLEQFRIHEAAQEIYQFVWHEFADVYLEASKLQFKDGILEKNTKMILRHILKRTLKLLHPFMPFITEKIWQEMHESGKSLLMIEEWPRTAGQAQ
ncbi:MAG: Valine-tRNA ligase [Candidatus Giovannonibacteria bacterium GW2011_GWA2_44_13b]|uniref:Valine--tRNA ligase n=2 Tax=Candidatus Giovannoniibacteriota TaxID=1752738 RepID=A0A0G1H427_9BACT|nr:MAG: Valine-tRNA ligase [Candidatus Giovannonibacteria bacterium GW2011_GWA2_44_13b]